MELRVAQSDQIAHQGVDLVLLGGDRVPYSVDEPEQRGSAVRGGGAGSALLGALVLWGAVDLPLVALRLELQLDERLGVGRCVVGAKAGDGSFTADRAVQGKADRVEQEGLARPGGTVDEEQAVLRETVEVDLGAACVGAERRDGDPVRSHAAPPEDAVASATA